jgi:5'-AMP-activated protein kinase regulatory gamma subunit
MACELLAQVQVQDLSHTSGPVVVVDSRKSLAHTFLTMVNNNILCAPVLDKSAGSFMGLIDMIDIACFVVDIAKDNERLGSDYIDFLSKEEEFKCRKTSDVADLSKRNSMFPVAADASLLDAVKIMANNHVQRIPILNDNGQIVNLLTQSAIITFLSQHIDQLGPSVNKTLKELNFERKPVIAIDHNKPAIEAFKLMVENRISGLAVLDDNKKLMANISARDLRSIQQDAQLFERLYYSVGEFVSHVRQANYRAVHPSICCTFDDTFHKIIMRLAAARIHRIYVVDEHRHPISVISLQDMLAKILELDSYDAVPIIAGSAGL